MNDEPFGRQPQPFIVTITGGEAIDRDTAAHNIAAFLDRYIDIVERSHRVNEEIIRCYPRAVND